MSLSIIKNILYAVNGSKNKEDTLMSGQKPLIIMLVVKKANNHCKQLMPLKPLN